MDNAGSNRWLSLTRIFHERPVGLAVGVILDAWRGELREPGPLGAQSPLAPNMFSGI
jgi:hypothetical protein